MADSFVIQQQEQFANGTTLRTIELYESAYNAKKLDENKWSFQIAKSVATGDQTTPTYNVIWQSQHIAPHTRIKWLDTYGLNWTMALPDPGVTVTVGGDWQACSLGQVFDIDSNGFWAQSSVSSDKNFMKVGKVNYKYPGADGLHIVVGVQNSSGNFDVIFVDPTALSVGDTAKYQPQELVEWWYQTGMRTATMISSASTAIGGVDFSKPAPTTQHFYYSTTYNYQSGTWITSEDAPPGSLYAPPQGQGVLSSPPQQLFSLWSTLWQGILSIAVASDKQATVSARLTRLLEVKYKDVEVKFLDGLDISITLGTPKNAKQNSNDSIGAPNDDIQQVIEDSLQYLVDDGDLDTNETWTVKKILNN